MGGPQVWALGDNLSVVAQDLLSYDQNRVLQGLLIGTFVVWNIVSAVLGRICFEYVRLREEARARARVCETKTHSDNLTDRPKRRERMTKRDRKVEAE